MVALYGLQFTYAWFPNALRPLDFGVLLGGLTGLWVLGMAIWDTRWPSARCHQKNYVLWALIAFSVVAYLPFSASEGILGIMREGLYAFMLLSGVFYLGCQNALEIYGGASADIDNRRFVGIAAATSCLLLVLQQSLSWLLWGRGALKGFIEGVIAETGRYLESLFIWWTQLFPSALRSPLKARDTLEGIDALKPLEGDKAKMLQGVVREALGEVASWEGFEIYLVGALMLLLMLLVGLILRSLIQRARQRAHPKLKGDGGEWTVEKSREIDTTALLAQVKAKFAKGPLPRDKVQRCYLHWLRYWSARGLPIGITETPRQFVERLVLQKEPQSNYLAPFVQLTALYEKQCYGEINLSPSEIQWVGSEAAPRKGHRR